MAIALGSVCLLRVSECSVQHSRTPVHSERPSSPQGACIRISDSEAYVSIEQRDMTAFVTGCGAVGCASSSFVGRDVCVERKVRPTLARVSMRILDGLDTICQQPYTFSRYILGPFQGVTISPNSDEEERELAMKAAYRHVFGNAYVMEEERAELAIAESQFKLGALSVREFVRALAKSYAYRKRFFEGAGQYRFIELNFMHLLGRAPDSQQEMSTHVKLCVQAGYDAEIDSYIDSEEYANVFGEDTVPFLRFRGAYTPCDSFNKQCALKGGWANSDKAMGGAALSGYNGSSGRQMSTLISAYVTDETTPYEAVAENTPLKSTAPNWYAAPNPALPRTPAYVSEAEVQALSAKVQALQSQYDTELARKNSTSRDPLAPFRAMTREMGAMLNRGFAYSGGDALLANPYAKLMGTDEGPLTEGGCKSSDYKRFWSRLENDTLSRIEKELEETKADLRVLQKALAASTPVTPALLVGLTAKGPAVAEAATPEAARPRVSVTARPPRKVEPERTGPKIGPIQLPAMSMPEMPSLPSFPFGKKEE